MFEPLIQNLTTGDGQVAVTATQITAGAGVKARRMNVTFANVGGLNETLVVTISRNGGTARRLKRVVLDVNEQLEICGLPLNGTDSLLAATTNALSVDYVVSVAADNSPQTMVVYDEFGGVKTAPYIIEQLDAVLEP